MISFSTIGDFIMRSNPFVVCGFVVAFSSRASFPTNRVQAGPAASPDTLCLAAVCAGSTPVARHDFDLREAVFKRDRKRIGELPNKPAIAAKHAEGQKLQSSIPVFDQLAAVVRANCVHSEHAAG